MGVWDFIKAHMSVVIHVLVWLVLFAVPLLYGIENDEAMRFARRNCVMLCGLMISFYGNYLWAIDKLLFKRRYLAFVVFNLLLFVVVMYVRQLFNWWIDDAEGIAHNHVGKHGRMFSLFMFNDFIFTLLAISASFGIKHLSGLMQIEIERKKLENETLTSELSLLKYQIQPHFFFNCLNNIYSLIVSSPSDAQRAVMHLSKMMRFVLYDSSSTIPLQKEIDFLRNYIALMRLRLNEKSTVSVSFPECVEGISIPSLLFIPLIENAFKHGVGPGGVADINCVMDVSETRLYFCVENKDFSVVPSEDKSHSGIGLANLRKRLDIMYGDDCSFHAALDSDDGIFRASIEIPIETKR